MQELFRRIEALYEHYGVERGQKGADIKLALKLAFDHVPGFQISDSQRGRPAKWKGPRSLELYADVRAVQKRSGLSISAACDWLARNHRRYKGEKGSALNTRFYEVPKNAPLWSDMERYREAGAPMDDILIEHFSDLRNNSAD